MLEMKSDTFFSILKKIKVLLNLVFSENSGFTSHAKNMFSKENSKENNNVLKKSVFLFLRRNIALHRMSINIFRNSKGNVSLPLRLAEMLGEVATVGPRPMSGARPCDWPSSGGGSV